MSGFLPCCLNGLRDVHLAGWINVRLDRCLVGWPDDRMLDSLADMIESNQTTFISQLAR
jgi:hypothetical protein